MDPDRSVVAFLLSKPTRVVTGAMLAVALTATPMVSPVAADAVSASTELELSETQRQVEQANSDYENAQSKLAELQNRIEANAADIADIEAQMPAQQDRARQAMRNLYRYKSNTNTLMGIVLKTTSLDDVITTVTYMNQIQDSSSSEVKRLTDMEAKLEEKKVELENAKQQAELEQQKAADALSRAQQLRSDAQAKAEREAAEELARLASTTTPAEGEGTDSDNTSNSATTPGQSAGVVVDPGVNWNVSREDFIAEWSGRIDAYLAGSPLAGYGRVFAEASWDSTVDPRWSPAIAAIESSKGAYCFRDFNAWGWMTSRRFSSWDESIRAHVAFLGSVYGTTLTPAAAMKYCPPTWQDWYNKVGSQMNTI